MTPEEEERLLKVWSFRALLAWLHTAWCWASADAEDLLESSSQHKERRCAEEGRMFPPLVQGFFAEVREVDRDNEVNRILGAFKLNPFEQMGLRFDATHEEAKRQYRKVSLLIHPDKCKHPLATSAFEVLGSAHQQLQDEEAVRELRHALNLARGRPRPCAPGHACPAAGSECRLLSWTVPAQCRVVTGWWCCCCR